MAYRWKEPSVRLPHPTLKLALFLEPDMKIQQVKLVWSQISRGGNSLAKFLVFELLVKAEEQGQ